MLQLNELCRLCAQKKRHKLDLFTGLTEEEAKILLAKISLCLSISVTQEDLLPKMICFDCQKTVEQFNAYRVKCLKAEERLNKMLSLALPIKLNIPTGIKQECSEPDFYFVNNQMKIDSPNLGNEILPLVNLKSACNVKSEVDDSSNEFNGAQSTQLLKIISEEMVNQHKTDDIKQPHIKIVSENLNEEFKISNISETNQIYTCDIKITPETLISQEEINMPCLNLNSVNQINFTTVPDIKEQVTENISELGSNKTVQKSNPTVVEKLKKKRKKGKQGKYKPNILEDEPDEKYLTLKEGEVCDIDLEEMGALIKKKENPNSKFQCKKCNKLFTFFKCFKKHKQWHDSEPEVFICDFCKNNSAPNFEFSSHKSLTTHIQRKHLNVKENNVECHFCAKTLSTITELKVHYRKVHDETRVLCKICGKKLKNQYSLNNHLKVHQEEKPYVCDLCGQSFKWGNALKVHITWHKQEKNFLCSECGKKFTSKKNLTEHLNIHSGKKPFTCDTCNASFTQFSAFSKHLYMHNENSKIHKCDQCQKAFSHAFMLKRHLIRHTGIRPFKCSTCPSSFKSQPELRFHVKIHQEKQYKCDVCGKKFAAMKTLKDHMVQHTGIKHICPIPGCGKTYVQRFSLTKHFSRMHPSFSIIKKKGGRKAQPQEDSKEEQQTQSGFIQYDFKEKESYTLENSEEEQQTEPVLIQYNLKEAELNLLRNSKRKQLTEPVLIQYNLEETGLNFLESSKEEQQTEPVIIQYNLEDTGLSLLEQSKEEQQTESFIIQYNVEETALNLLENTKEDQQTESFFIQYELEENGLNDGLDFG